MDIKELLQHTVLQAARQAVTEGVFAAEELPDVMLEVPPQKEFGDYATNFAMQAARQAKANPRLIAQAVVDRIQVAWLNKAVIAGPGFINFHLKSDWLYDCLAHVVAAGADYGNTQIGGGRKVQVEFVSANPTGPLHVGHGRGAAVGSALVNLLRAAGYAVEAEFYINDAGNQIDNLAASVNARYLELLGQPTEFPADGYHGQDIIDTAQRIVERDGDQYLALSETERLAVLKEMALTEKLDGLKKDLAAFQVYFDHWFSERSLHAENAIQEVCRVFQAKGHMYEQGGALWLRSSAYGDDKDRVVIRDNGVPTYLAADIAYHKNKYERGFATLINIWGADHHGYIARMKAAAAALGYDPASLEVLILQMVSLYRNGDLVKMSKRTGQGVTLNELVEETGCDAARFFFVMRSLDSQLDFDLDLATSKTNKNPVYYIQYAHARICNILRHATELNVAVPAGLPAKELAVLTEPAEIDLIKKINVYPEEVSRAAQDRAVHHIALYVLDLAGLFHSFYNCKQCRVVGAEERLQAARLILVLAVRQTLRHALAVLGVSAPEEM